MDFSKKNGGPGAAVPEVLAVQEDRADRVRAPTANRISSDALSVYLRGGPRYRLGRKTYRFVAPVAIMVPEGMVDHDLQEGRVEGTCVLFKGRGLLREDRSSAGLVRLCIGTTRSSVPVLKSTSLEEAIVIVDLLREIGRITADDAIGQLQRASRLFAALAAYIGLKSATGAPGGHREAMRLRDLLDRRAFDRVALSELYTEIDFSSAHAGAVFRKAFGFSPVEYRTRLRLRRARELLVSSRLNVGEVASAVGFEDALYFSRVFRNVYGRTPSSLIYDFKGSRR